MEVLNIEKSRKDEWNNFVKNHAFGHFLESFEWGEVVCADGEKVRQVAVMDKGKIIAGALIIKYELPLNKSYLYIPRGPALDWDKIKNPDKINKDQEALMMILDEVKKFGQSNNAIFLRIDPEIEASDRHFEFWKQIGFTKSPKEVQPKMTIVLDLLQSEEQILKNMKSKTRYNIRLADRKGVKIKMSTNVSGIDTFYDLMLKTSRRDNFYPHTKKHYQDLIKILGPKNIAKIFLAEYKKKIIAATIVSFFGQKAIYLHGASDNEYRNLMSTYLLQWRAISEAKKAGSKLYDFGGVVPESENKHAWVGISRFKRGFGGREQEFIGAWDIPYSTSQYKLFSFTSNIRRKIKRA